MVGVLLGANAQQAVLLVEMWVQGGNRAVRCNEINMSPDDQADAIVAQILGHYKDAGAILKTGMARATLVVDENVDFLAAPLQEADFRVLGSPPNGMADFEVKKVLLAHRILVTKNTEGFLADAPVLDYGIIGLDALPFVYQSNELGSNPTARMISDVLSEQGLEHERYGFVLMLKPNGKHVFRRLG